MIFPTLKVSIRKWTFSNSHNLSSPHSTMKTQ